MDLPRGAGGEGHPEMLSGPAYHDSVPGPTPTPMEDLAGPFLGHKEAKPFWDKQQIRLIEALQMRPYYLGKEKKLGQQYANLAKALGSMEEIQPDFVPDKELLDLIRLEVGSSFTPEEIASFENFKQFYDKVDVQHAYEEDWDPKEYKLYYKMIWNELRKAPMESVKAETDKSDYSFFDALNKVADHKIDKETLDIMKDVVSDSESLIGRVGKQLQKLKKSTPVKSHGAEEGRPDREAQKQANMEKLEIESPEQFGIKNKGLLQSMAEEHGIGDLLGYSFRTNKIEVIGTEKILLIDYDLKPLHTRDVIGIDLSAAEPGEMEEAEIEGASEGSDLEKLLGIMSKLGLYYDADFMSYSGRGMFGKRCLGVSLKQSEAQELEKELKGAGVSFVKDAMGKDVVIYFPNIKEGFEGLLDKEEDEEVESSAVESASKLNTYWEKKAKSSASAEGKFHIVDWMSNVMFDGQKFDSFDDAEAFLSEALGEEYEESRQDFSIIPDKGSRDPRYLEPNHPAAKIKKAVSATKAASLEQLKEAMHKAKVSYEEGLRYYDDKHKTYNPATRIENLLEHVSDLVGYYGVEAYDPGSDNPTHPRYQYINSGDSYGLTIVYDADSRKFLYTDIGSIIESHDSEEESVEE